MKKLLVRYIMNLTYTIIIRLLLAALYTTPVNTPEPCNVVTLICIQSFCHLEFILSRPKNISTSFIELQRIFA